MDYLGKDLFLFKATQKYNNGDCTILTELTQKRCDQNYRDNIETEIVLDLNIISDIRKFISLRAHVALSKAIRTKKNNKTLSVVEGVIAFFQNLKGLYIAPAFALLESHDKLKVANYKALNRFLNDYLKECVNSYDALPFDALEKLENTPIIEHLELIKATLLAIHHTHATKSHLSNIAKFRAFLDIFEQNAYHTMDSMIREIAKYFFCDPNLLPQEWNIIINNFIKKSTTHIAYNSIQLYECCLRFAVIQIGCISRSPIIQKI